MHTLTPSLLQRSITSRRHAARRPPAATHAWISSLQTRRQVRPIVSACALAATAVTATIASRARETCCSMATRQSNPYSLRVALR